MKQSAEHLMMSTHRMYYYQISQIIKRDTPICIVILMVSLYNITPDGITIWKNCLVLKLVACHEQKAESKL